MSEKLRGAYPILSTPFAEDDSIDEGSLRNLVDFDIEGGVDGLGIAYGSEIPHLTDDERTCEVEIVADQIDGRVPLVVNCDHNSTVGAVMLSRRAEDAGADSVMIMPPNAVSNTNDDELVRHYEAVSKVTTVPIFIQEAGRALSNNLILRLTTEVERVRYIKAEVSPIPLKIRERRALLSEDVVIFGGAGGSLFVDELRNGGEGTMPHCEFPEVWSGIWDAWQAGDTDRAAEIHQRHMIFQQFTAGFAGDMTVHKEVLRKRGVIQCAKVRAPAVPHISPEISKELDRVLDEMGIQKP